MPAGDSTRERPTPHDTTSNPGAREELPRPASRAGAIDEASLALRDTIRRKRQNARARTLGPDTVPSQGPESYPATSDALPEADSGSAVLQGPTLGPLDHETEVSLALEELVAGGEVALTAHDTVVDLYGGTRAIDRTHTIRIPRGLGEGDRVRYKGLLNGGTGDLYVTIRVKKHRCLRCIGHDLYVRVPVMPWETVLGAIVDVPTLNGPVRISVKPGTQASQKLRLPGRGLPRADGTAGDLYCIVRIVTPEHPTEHEREAYKALAQVSNRNPRDALFNE
jgi:hypothetical protein